LRDAAETLQGTVVERAGGACVLVERFYPADHPHGLLRIADAGGPALSAAPELALLGGRPEPDPGSARGLLFLDLETTGLAGGAGTYAFLVGCAVLERHGLRVRQLLLPGYQHERTLLAEVEALVRDTAGLVSYNGKTFDVPVLETRFLYNRLRPPFDGIGHVDMLHPARRFWRGAAPAGAWPEGDSCRLSVLERVLFGVRRLGDVPGFEIPSRYFDFMRSGNAAPLEPVLEHNRLDLISLALLTARAVRLLAGAPGSCESARESLAAGRLLERAGRVDAAERCYRDAAARANAERGPDGAQVRAHALRALAVCCRRARRHDEAADAWHRIVCDRSAPAAIRREALEALAIHFEHRARDLSEARRYAQLSLAERVGTRAMQHGRHRLARLDRKLERWRERGAPGQPLLPQG
ncbi:MAG TPA: ribonuclease H-like domain-containing protein, partial [Vicinamibacterales bacterium]